MDAKKLGQFISELRKEQGITQRELAEKLQVTDKAVSRWERGVGLPDINSLEPLAEALDVSVVEIMRSERIPDGQISRERAAEAVTEAIDMGKRQRRKERKQLLWIGLAVLAAMGIVFLAEAHSWDAVFLWYIPLMCIPLSVVLAVLGIMRAAKRLPCRQTFVWAGVCGVIAVSPLLVMIGCLLWLYWFG